MIDPLTTARQRYADAERAEQMARLRWADLREGAMAGTAPIAAAAVLLAADALEQARRATDTALVAAILLDLRLGVTLDYVTARAKELLAALTAQESERR